MTRYPYGYNVGTKTMAELRARYEPHMHPEFARRLFAWLESHGGKFGIGGGYRESGSQPDKPGFAPEGKSFHQAQVFPSGNFYCAVDLVVKGEGGAKHRSPFWSEVPQQGSPEADVWGLHCNIGTPPGGEAWHMQPMIAGTTMIDGWQSWINAGSPDLEHWNIPSEGDTDMKPIATGPERAYDSRRTDQTTQYLRDLNAGVPMGPMAGGEQRRIVIGRDCAEAEVHVTVIGGAAGYVSVSGFSDSNPSSLVNVNGSGVEQGTGGFATPESAVYIRTAQPIDGLVVDVFQRG